MRSRRPRDVELWVQSDPPLEKLREAFPAEWEMVQRDLAEMMPRGDVGELKAYVSSLAARPVRHARSGSHGRGAQLLSAEVRRRMAVAAIERISLAAVAGVTGGRLRFNLVNGFVAQKLLFERDLERKPVSWFWFRLWWPLVWQRRFLMPLVVGKGIYCFYSRRLVTALAELVGERPCLELAAGDGTLSRFLTDAGVDVTATDDHSWQHSVHYPDAVLREDAREASRTRQPEVVICSWPPADNQFEREVFKTPSVALYIVISSRHRFASGNWEHYEQQSEFDFAEDPKLSRLVLPPELEAAVYVFRRRPPAS